MSWDTDVFGHIVGRGVHPKWVSTDPDRQREQHDHPYSYSEFFIYGDRQVIRSKGLEAVYSDRLQQWDYEKYERCCEEHPKAWRRPVGDRAAMSAWMTAYMGKPVDVVALAEGCNVSSGYPYWIVWFREKPVRKKCA
jgi:hypothetical protein